MSAHSAGAYIATLLVMINVMKGDGRAPPTLTKPGLILPSSLNVRQKAAVATLCTLWLKVCDASLFHSSISLSHTRIYSYVDNFRQVVTKICRLTWLTNSALVDEPKCGVEGGAAGSQPMSTDTQEPK